ncbi:MAG: CvpA family protein [Succinivibrionaceae bacterium]|nr:CvpA family protein [Ruminobacter sp.]MDY5779725.1 CvpA family protein [Succinivibrionaceae bacterium]MEE1339979.1 CvpA family protein [Succinivibrionaceae bacterium]
MQWIDIVILGIVLLSALISVARGFVKEMLSLVAWIAAFFVTLYLYGNLSSLITFVDNSLARNAIAIFVLFFGTLIIIGFVNMTLTAIIKKTGLSGTDRLLGMVFGAARGIIILLFMGSVLVFLENMDLLQSISRESWYKNSLLLPEVIKASKMVLNLLGLMD